VTENPNKLKTMKMLGLIGDSIFKRISFILEPGITTQKLNDAACSTLKYQDCVPVFKGFGDPPFPAETCISLNEEICHGIPSERPIRSGDLVSVDLGIQGGGFIVDACRTFEMGEMSKDADFLNYWTKTALKRALRHIKAGVCWNDIARIIENTAHKKGLGIVKDMCGHGVGSSLHEDPLLRNYICPENKDIFLQEGQTICVEPMFSLGTGECEIAENKWTVITKDRTLSSHWEHCVVITKNGCEILL